MNNKLTDLQNILKIKFNKLELLKKSLVHKSFNNVDNNEKLEFLGDRVLGLVLSKELINIYPKEKAESYKNLNRSDEKITSDCLEAIIGAIFLDKGIDVSEKFILNNWKKYLKVSTFTQIDSKTLLQEYSLKKYKKLPIYKISRQTGPIHRPTFKVEVGITASKKYSATGSSKKNAQQNAAKKLLEDLKIK